MAVDSKYSLEKEDHSRDAAFNKALHGKSATSKGGITAMFGKSADAKKAAVDEYFKHWDNTHIKDETAEDREVYSIRPLGRARLANQPSLWSLLTNRLDAGTAS